jgi:hypothetical protein
MSTPYIEPIGERKLANMITERNTMVNMYGQPTRLNALLTPIRLRKG